jgi:hypothetical protein
MKKHGNAVIVFGRDYFLSNYPGNSDTCNDA